MSRIKLDLNEFKHVSSNNKTTKLKHKHGHFLVLAHSALSPDAQKQLGALSKLPAENATSSQANEMQDQKMADGGMMYQEGGRAPAPEGTAQHDTSKKEQIPGSKQFEQGSDPQPANRGEPVNSLSGAWERLTHPMAEGGMLKPQDEYAKKIHENDVSLRPDGQMDPAFSEKNVDDKNLEKEVEQKDNEARPKYAEGTPDIGGVKQIVPERMPGPPVDYNPQPKVTGEVGFAPEDLGLIIGHTINAIKSGASKAKEVATQAGQGVSQGIKQSSGIDLSGTDEQQAPQQPSTQQAPVEQSTQPQQQTPPAQTQQSMPDQNSPAQAVPDQSGTVKPNYSMQGAEDIYSKGLQKEQAGLAQEGAQKGNLLEAQAGVQDQRSKAMDDLANQQQNEFNTLNTERLAHQQDIQNNLIDPEKYWQTHSKIATGIGMILAGFNPAGHPNAALNFLKFQMENNLNAQKENLSAKNNLLTANLNQFHNLHDATEMTRIMQNDAAAHQLLAAAPKAQSALAAAAAKVAAGKLLQDSSQRVQALAQYRTMMGLMNPQNKAPSDNEEAWQHNNQMLNYLNPEMAKFKADRHVPGVGDASIPVLDAARNSMRAHKDVNNTMNEVLQFAQQHAGSLDPKVRAQGQALINQLQSQVRVAEDQGVYKESEAKFMSSTIGDSPASFLANYKTTPKVKELQHIKQQQYNTLLSQYGLKPQQLPSIPDQQESNIKTMGGVKYQQGSDGNWHRVK